jgi:hypothetical protein
MNDTTGCQHVRQSLGVYVLGAIDPAERAEVDAHLTGCPECRDELAELAGLPALLGRVPPDEAERIALAPDEPAADAPGVVDLAPLLDRMAQHQLAQRRRMNRWRGLAAAAAVVLIAAGSAIGAVTIGGSSGPSVTLPGHWQTVQASNPVTHARVMVKYASMPWGTSLETEVYGIPAGTTCQFWVVGSGGQRWQAGSWTVASTWRDTWYPGSSSVPASAVHGFEITSGGTVLMRLQAT